MSICAYFSFIAPVFNVIVFPNQVLVSGYSAINTVTNANKTSLLAFVPQKSLINRVNKKSVIFVNNDSF